MDNITEVRTRLVKAKDERGRIAQILRDTGTDRRTVLDIISGKRTPHAATVDKLLAYFKKVERRAKQ